MTVIEPFLYLQGGTDVSPALYGETRHLKTQVSDTERDIKEVGDYLRAVKDGHPIIGVCRGAQLLCVLNGGSLYQHTRSHNESHPIHTRLGIFNNVAAGHHQVMNPKGNYIVYGWDGERETEVISSSGSTEVILVGAPEIIWYPNTRSLAIQPHPEWMSEDNLFNVWLDGLIFELTGLKDVIGTLY